MRETVKGLSFRNSKFLFKNEKKKRRLLLT